MVVKSFTKQFHPVAAVGRVTVHPAEVGPVPTLMLKEAGPLFAEIDAAEPPHPPAAIVGAVLAIRIFVVSDRDPICKLVRVVHWAPPKPICRAAPFLQIAGLAAVSEKKLRRLNPVKALLANCNVPSKLDETDERPLKEKFPPAAMDIPFEKTKLLLTVPATAGQVIVAEPLVEPNPEITHDVVLSTPQVSFGAETPPVPV